MTAVCIAFSLSALCLLWVVVLLCRALARERAENRRLRHLLSLPGGRGEAEALRRLRHDLRHYLITAGEAPLPAGDREALRASLAASSETAAGPVAVLAAYYRREASALGAAADILLDCEDAAGEQLPDLCLVLSNLLENAVEALRREGGGWLRARSAAAGGYVSLVVGNSCAVPPRRVLGRWLSSKAEGRVGEGLSTVEDIARKYGGSARFSWEDGEFRASVFLPRPAGQAAGREVSEEKVNV